MSANLESYLDMAQKTAASAEDLKNHIETLLEKAQTAFREFFGNPTQPIWQSQVPKFSLLGPDTKIVIWQISGDSVVNHESILGPLMDKLSSIKKQDAQKFAEAFGNHNNPRRASPLWVSTHQLDNEWVLVLTHLKARYTDHWQGREHQLVTDFLDSPPLSHWTITPVHLKEATL